MKHKHAELIKQWADGFELEKTTNYQLSQPRPIWYAVKSVDGLGDIDNPEWVYRIKPPEVPQWRKDMAQALNDGKEVQIKDKSVDTWFTCRYSSNEFLNPEIHFTSDIYRIKPQPKPDVERYGVASLNGVAIGTTNTQQQANLKLIWDGETGELKDAEVLHG